MVKCCKMRFGFLFMWLGRIRHSFVFYNFVLYFRYSDTHRVTNYLVYIEGRATIRGMDTANAGWVWWIQLMNRFLKRANHSKSAIHLESFYCDLGLILSRFSIRFKNRFFARSGSAKIKNNLDPVSRSILVSPSRLDRRNLSRTVRNTHVNLRRQHQRQISRDTQLSACMTSCHIVLLLDEIDKVSIHVLIIYAKEYFAWATRWTTFCGYDKQSRSEASSKRAVKKNLITLVEWRNMASDFRWSCTF